MSNEVAVVVGSRREGSVTKCLAARECEIMRGYALFSLTQQRKTFLWRRHAKRCCFENTEVVQPTSDLGFIGNRFSYTSVPCFLFMVLIHGSYSAVLKSVAGCLPDDAFAHKPVGILSVGGGIFTSSSASRASASGCARTPRVQFELPDMYWGSQH